MTNLKLIQKCVLSYDSEGLIDLIECLSPSNIDQVYCRHDCIKYDNNCVNCLKDWLEEETVC